MQTPLEGIRVIDLTQFQQGPVSTMLLADMGAEVIKIEARGKGDPGRHFGPWGPGGTSAYFEANNRNKKSITVDTRKEKGKEIVYRLVKKADIFAQNFRPGVAARLGFGYEKLSEINSRIIYLTGSAFGLKGPMGKMPGYDAVGQAMSGMLNLVWSPQGTPPTSLGFSVSDQTGAFMLAFGAVLALFHREKTGIGQEVDASLLGSTLALVGWTFQGHIHPGSGQGTRFQVARARVTRVRGSEAGITSSHIAKDGKAILLVLNGRELQLKSYKIMGLESFIEDPRFASWDQIKENLEPLLSAIDEKIRTKNRDEWLRLFQEGEVISAPIHTPAEAASHPQVLANEYVAEINHPKEGPMKVVGIPMKLHKTPGRLGIAPDLGQHTEEILTQLGGYTLEEIAQMKKEEVI
jgi:CoA:oxalate CoA-transferase